MLDRKEAYSLKGNGLLFFSMVCPPKAELHAVGGLSALRACISKYLEIRRVRGNRLEVGGWRSKAKKKNQFFTSNLKQFAPCALRFLFGVSWRKACQQLHLLRI